MRWFRDTELEERILRLENIRAADELAKELEKEYDVGDIKVVFWSNGYVNIYEDGIMVAYSSNRDTAKLRFIEWFYEGDHN